MFPEYSRSRLTEWLKRGDVTVDGIPAIDDGRGSMATRVLVVGSSM